MVRSRICGDEATAAAGTPRCPEITAAAWATDARALQLSRGCLALVCMRAVRGTLRTLTPEEAAYFGNESAPATPGEQLLISAAAEALSCWPPPSSMEEFLLLMRGIYLALKAALALDAAGALLMPAQQLNRELRDSLKILFEGTFGASPDAPRTLRALRSLDDDGCR